jgi:hypothetical protein
VKRKKRRDGNVAGRRKCWKELNEQHNSQLKNKWILISAQGKRTAGRCFGGNDGEEREMGNTRWIRWPEERRSISNRLLRPFGQSRLFLGGTFDAAPPNLLQPSLGSIQTPDSHRLEARAGRPCGPRAPGSRVRRTEYDAQPRGLSRLESIRRIN